MGKGQCRSKAYDVGRRAHINVKLLHLSAALYSNALICCMLSRFYMSLLSRMQNLKALVCLVLDAVD